MRVAVSKIFTRFEELCKNKNMPICFVLMLYSKWNFDYKRLYYLIFNHIFTGASHAQQIFPKASQRKKFENHCFTL